MPVGEAQCKDGEQEMGRASCRKIAVHFSTNGGIVPDKCLVFGKEEQKGKDGTCK